MVDQAENRELRIRSELRWAINEHRDAILFKVWEAGVVANITKRELEEAFAEVLAKI